jgi:hypothetical protein
MKVLEDIIKCNNVADNGEELVWLSIDEIEKSKIKPTFIQERIREILSEKKTIHVVEERDRG